MQQLLFIHDVVAFYVCTCASVLVGCSFGAQGGSYEFRFGFCRFGCGPNGGFSAEAAFGVLGFGPVLCFGPTGVFGSYGGTLGPESLGVNLATPGSPWRGAHSA